MIAVVSFSAVVNGALVEYSAGASVPLAVVKECNLIEKGLVNEVGRKEKPGRNSRA